MKKRGVDNVVIVLLRRPIKSSPQEDRSDPFWEFGSFGCTGCHRTNLLNPKKVEELKGVRLAFAQGGDLGFRLVKLTPPVDVVKHKNRAELIWKTGRMPFRYVSAPLLIDIDGNSDMGDWLVKRLQTVKRSTPVAAFASAFRSRRKPLRNSEAEELIRCYQAKEKKAKASDFATEYQDALPYPPSNVDRDRKRTLNRHRMEAADPKNAKKPNKSKRC